MLCLENYLRRALSVRQQPMPLTSNFDKNVGTAFLISIRQFMVIKAGFLKKEDDNLVFYDARIFAAFISNIT